MIELVIYCLGVTAAITACMAVMCFCAWCCVIILEAKVIKTLKSTYNHLQLMYFMRELKEKGYAQCIDEIGKDTD